MGSPAAHHKRRQAWSRGSARAALLGALLAWWPLAPARALEEVVVQIPLLDGKKLGGNITVHSQVGHGTVFHVTFPLRLKEHTEAADV